MLERRDIDELLLFDVSASRNNSSPQFDQISELCSNLFCPVSIGGGIRSLVDARQILGGGADKVGLLSAAVANPGLIRQLADKFGAQAVVVSADHKDGQIYTHCGRNRTDWTVRDWARKAASLGAGELLLTDIARDGMMCGYNLEAIREVSQAVSIPVIAAGGCGTYEHMAQALRAGAHAVAAGAMFQFTEQTPKGAARYLAEQGFQVRL